MHTLLEHTLYLQEMDRHRKFFYGNKIKAMNWDVKNIDKAGKILLRRHKTLAVAESVTAGNLQAVLSLATNARLFFQGGITTYNIGQKCRHLLVEPTHALETNCVSKKVAIQMATEVCNLFKSDYGIGITGYASPVPEKNIEKLFAFIAIASGAKVVLTRKVNAIKKEPSEVQAFFTEQAITLLNSALSRK